MQRAAVSRFVPLLALHFRPNNFSRLGVMIKHTMVDMTTMSSMMMAPGIPENTPTGLSMMTARGTLASTTAAPLLR